MSKVIDLSYRQLTFNEAKKMQFKIVNSITKFINGNEMLSQGDLGCTRSYGRPIATVNAEKVIADLFNGEDCALVRGAGTGGISWALAGIINTNDGLLVHKQPLFTSTETTIERQGYIKYYADFNCKEDIVLTLEQNSNQIKAVFIQNARQVLSDSYDVAEVIDTIKTIRPDLPILVDDNYCVFKKPKIGIENGADLSTFSSFKLRGPEGIGVIVGKKQYIEKIRKWQYSGGSQVQGHEALECLRGMVFSPVSLAVHSESVDKAAEMIADLNLPEVKNVFVANCQSKGVFVEFHDLEAEQLCKKAIELNTAPYPVGAESRYEIVPTIGLMSGTMRLSDPDRCKHMLRMSPMKSGPETLVRIFLQILGYEVDDIATPSLFKEKQHILTESEARIMQYHVVDCIMKHFSGYEILTQGDLGCNRVFGRPETTYKAEKVIADIFEAEDAVMVRGAGTGGIAWMISSVCKPNEKVLVNRSPLYITTQYSFERQGVVKVEADFNNIDEVMTVLREHHGEIKAVYAQYADASQYDYFDINEVMRTIKKEYPELPILIDDNYVAFKKNNIGIQNGADLSSFSCFKILGAEGVGVIVGKKKYIEKIRKWQYSGGSQVQGHEALDSLRGMVMVTVANAVSFSNVDITFEELKRIKHPLIKDIHMVVAQSKGIRIEFTKPITDIVIDKCVDFGFANYPVGAESRYDICPMLSRMSYSYRMQEPERAQRMIRLMLNRGGPETFIRMLTDLLDYLLVIEEG